MGCLIANLVEPWVGFESGGLMVEMYSFMILM